MQQSQQQELNRENLQLAMPIAASFLTTLERMGYWARAVHELMYEANPLMMTMLHESGKLSSYLDNQQEVLSEAARQLEKEYRRSNPLPFGASHLMRASWLNQAKSYSKEILLAEVSKSLLVLHDLQQEAQLQQ